MVSAIALACVAKTIEVVPACIGLFNGGMTASYQVRADLLVGAMVREPLDSAMHVLQIACGRVAVTFAAAAVLAARVVIAGFAVTNPRFARR